MPLARRVPAGGRRAKRESGQALIEFALVLPVLLVLFTSMLDFSRVYRAVVAMQGATRIGADHAARFATDAASAASLATTAVCREAMHLPSYVGTGTTCSVPSTRVTAFSRATSGAGITPGHPVATVTLTTELPVETVLPYPFIGDGRSVQLVITETLQVIQNR